MAGEDVASDWFQIITAVMLIVGGGDGGPKAREQLADEDFFENRLDARPGECCGELRLAVGLRQLSEQASPSIKATLRGGPVLLADVVRNAARAVDD